MPKANSHVLQMFKLIKLQSPKLASLEVCEIIVCFGLPRKLRLVQCNLVILVNPMRIEKLHSFNFIITKTKTNIKKMNCNARGYVLFFLFLFSPLVWTKFLAKYEENFEKKVISFLFSIDPLMFRRYNIVTSICLKRAASQERTKKKYAFSSYINSFFPLIALWLSQLNNQTLSCYYRKNFSI